MAGLNQKRLAVNARRGLRAGALHSPLRSAFSFIEVLFAVMILGIGFIMIAGIFPVAIAQTASSQEETIAANLVHGAVQAVSSIPDLQTIVPANGSVFRFTEDTSTPSGVSLWSLVKGNQILANDPRFAWVALIKRDGPNSAGQVPTSAQLIVIPVQVRNRSNFDNSDLVQTGSGATAAATLIPLAIKVTLAEGGTNPDTITITGNFPAAATPGAVVVMAGGTDASNRPAAGRVYRLGNPTTATNTFELLPGSDMTIGPPPLNAVETITSPTDAFIVGQGAAGINGNMAIGAYVTYIDLK